MTKITSGKRVKRETASVDRLRPIVIELFPFYCGVRIKGTREFYSVEWDTILALARKLDARARLAERRSA
jgi:hypothetical protein